MLAQSPFFRYLLSGAREEDHMRPDQYVGVTGFCRKVEVEYFLRALPPHCEIKAMVGVLMSFNSEGSHVQKYPLRYPNHSDIADLFVDHPQVLNLVPAGGQG